MGVIAGLSTHADSVPIYRTPVPFKPVELAELSFFGGYCARCPQPVRTVAVDMLAHSGADAPRCIAMVYDSRRTHQSG